MNEKDILKEFVGSYVDSMMSYAKKPGVKQEHIQAWTSGYAAAVTDTLTAVEKVFSELANDDQDPKNIIVFERMKGFIN